VTSRIEFLLLYGAVFAAAVWVASCSSPPEGTGGAAQLLAIECGDGREEPLIIGGEQVVEINVGDTFLCSISLDDLPSDAQAGLAATRRSTTWPQRRATSPNTIRRPLPASSIAGMGNASCRPLRPAARRC